ncbi:hypothetical protein LINPERHAP2_LOCUS9447 [Linum perenne]
MIIQKPVGDKLFGCVPDLRVPHYRPQVDHNHHSLWDVISFELNCCRCLAQGDWSRCV